MTDIALQEGEQLVGSGPVAAGDTVRWMIGDTISGVGATARVHILVKPVRPDITTNLIINTDRRTYHIELRANWDVFLNVLNVEVHDSASANQLCDILYGTEARKEGRNHRLNSPFYVQILRPLYWAGLLSQCAGDKRFGGERQFVKTPLWSVALRLETDVLVKEATRH